MTILEAGLKSSVYEAARGYLIAGVSVIPVKDKKPYIKGELWRQWMHHRPSLKTLDYWNKAALFRYGVATICGEVSNNLVVLDFDNLTAIDEFTAEFPRLHNTYSVASGSRRGAHFYYYVNDLPPSIKAPFIDLQSTGKYVVAPPSLHSSGNQYEIAQDREPMRLRHMDDVVRWMESKRLAPEKKLPAPIPTARPVLNKGKWMPPAEFLEYRRELFRKGSLNKQLAYLNNASEVAHNRNDTLYISARNLGELIAGGVLNPTEVEHELLQAALRIGLEEAETLRTIKSGIDAGRLTPRGFPSNLSI